MIKAILRTIRQYLFRKEGSSSDVATRNIYRDERLSYFMIKAQVERYYIEYDGYTLVFPKRQMITDLLLEMYSHDPRDQIVMLNVLLGCTAIKNGEILLSVKQELLLYATSNDFELVKENAAPEEYQAMCDDYNGIEREQLEKLTVINDEDLFK